MKNKTSQYVRLMSDVPSAPRCTKNAILLLCTTTEIQQHMYIQFRRFSLSLLDSPKKDEVTISKVSSTPRIQKGYVCTINDISEVRSIAISRSGHVVISSGSEGKLSTYNEAYELISSKVVLGLNMCAITISQEDILLAASVCKICKFDMQLNEVMSVNASDIKEWTNSFGIALGMKGRLYAAVVEKAIILNGRFNVLQSVC